jgi:hypothetical protein
VDARLLRWERVGAMKPGDVLDAPEELVLWEKG